MRLILTNQTPHRLSSAEKKHTSHHSGCLVLHSDWPVSVPLQCASLSLQVGADQTPCSRFRAIEKRGVSQIWWSRLHRVGLESTWFGITRWKLEDGSLAKSVSRRFSWSVEIMIMWWLALMMFISPAFPFIVFVCMGLSEAVHSYDALPLVIRKSRSVAEEHPNTSANGFRGYRLGIVALTPAPTVASARKPINVAAPAATIKPPTTEPTTLSLSNPRYMAAFARRKLSSVETQMKKSQMSDNKADRSGVVPGFSTTSDNSQGELK